MRKVVPVLFVFLAAGCSNPAETPAPSSSAAPAVPESPEAVKKAPDVAKPAVEEKAVKAAPPANAVAPAATAPKPILIPAGTKLNVILAEALSSGKNHAGDKFSGKLADALVIDGKTVIAKGANVEGKVVGAEDSGRVKGVASMSLALTGIAAGAAGKEKLAISTKVIAQEAEATKGRDAAIVGGAAGIGTAIGALAGGKKGAAAGAAVGGGAGVGTILATKGKEVEYPVEARLSFTTDKEIAVAP